jgi:4-alpha-glucanotransferase
VDPRAESRRLDLADWPAAYRDPDSPEVADFERRHQLRITFHKYLQWQMSLQLSEVQRHALARGMAIGLYHDLALATDRCGSDLWAYGRSTSRVAGFGSPPDDFRPKARTGRSRRRIPITTGRRATNCSPIRSARMPAPAALSGWTT